MFRGPSRQVMYLLSTRDSRCNDLDIIARSLHSRHQAPVTDLCRQIVVLFLETEGARHAAAAGINFIDFIACAFEHGDCRRGADQCFLMTMSVQQYFFSAAV